MHCVYVFICTGVVCMLDALLCHRIIFLGEYTNLSPARRGTAPCPVSILGPLAFCIFADPKWPLLSFTNTQRANLSGPVLRPSADLSTFCVWHLGKGRHPRWFWIYLTWKVKVKSLSRLWLIATPWTVAHQSPPSRGFSRQEYWSGLPFSLLQGILPSSDRTWVSHIAGRRFTIWAIWGSPELSKYLEKGWS